MLPPDIFSLYGQKVLDRGECPVLAPTFWRRRFGADVLAPRRFGADVLAPRRFGADTFWRRRFGAKTFWRRDVLAPDVLAPGCFGAHTFFYGFLRFKRFIYITQEMTCPTKHLIKHTESKTILGVKSRSPRLQWHLQKLH